MRLCIDLASQGQNFESNPLWYIGSKPLHHWLQVKNRHPRKLGSTSSRVSPHNELIWALIGLCLTIVGTLIPAFFTNMPWYWSNQGVTSYPLGVSFQIGAVLLVGCLGGKNAGALSQIAYLVIGLSGLSVFSDGGGLGYLSKPSFGYLLGFVPGAWLCGYLAFQSKARLESLAFSCFCGLITIHFFGLSYLLGLQVFNPAHRGIITFFQYVWDYSIYPFPGQMAVLCAVSLLAFCLRRIMFY